MAATGALGVTYDFDNSTVEVSGSTIRVKDTGITAAKLASDAVITAKILDSNVTFAKLAPRTVVTTSTGAVGEIIQYAVTTNGYTNGTFVSLTENPWSPDSNSFSVSLTTRGGPVRCEIRHTGSNTNFELDSNSAARISMYYDGTMFAQTRFNNDATGGNIGYNLNWGATTPALSAASHTLSVGIDTDGFRDGGAYTFVVYEVI
jgi:hypothetical protein